MSGGEYWDRRGPSQPGPTLKFTKVKDRFVRVQPATHLPQHTMCNHCAKRFVQFSKLQQHSRVHSGLRPFICHVCKVSFPQLQHLLHHQRAKHGPSHQWRHCPHCTKVLAAGTRAHFFHHIIHTHGAAFLKLPKMAAAAHTSTAECSTPREDLPAALPKLSLKLCLKKSSSSVDVAESCTTSWAVKKKKKKHKKHKLEREPVCVKIKMPQPQNTESKIATKSKNKAQSPPKEKPRIILKFKVPKCADNGGGDQTESMANRNANVHVNEHKPAGVTVPTPTKQEQFPDLVQSPSPKDSGIDDCSPLHETDHTENCSTSSGSSAASKSSSVNKECKVSPCSTTSKQRLVSKECLNSPTNTDSIKDCGYESCVDGMPERRGRKSPKSSHMSKAAGASTDESTKESPPSSGSLQVQFKKLSDGSLSAQHAAVEPFMVKSASVSPSPTPSLKLTISKKASGKLRGAKYTSSLHVSPAGSAPQSPATLRSSVSPSASPRSSRKPVKCKSPHSSSSASSCSSSFDGDLNAVYQRERAASKSPRGERKGNSPRMSRMDSWSPGRSSKSADSPRMCKLEREFPPMMDLDDDLDPYAFDDGPSNPSPNLLPYTSTLPKRSDKYKLDPLPPILEPQLLPSQMPTSPPKHQSRPRLTKQTDLPPRRKPRSSPVRNESKGNKVAKRKIKPPLSVASPTTPKRLKRGTKEHVSNDQNDKLNHDIEKGASATARKMSSGQKEEDCNMDSLHESKLESKSSLNVNNKPNPDTDASSDDRIPKACAQRIPSTSGKDVLSKTPVDSLPRKDVSFSGESAVPSSDVEEYAQELAEGSLPFGRSNGKDFDGDMSLEFIHTPLVKNGGSEKKVDLNKKENKSCVDIIENQSKMESKISSDIDENVLSDYKKRNGIIHKTKGIDKHLPPDLSAAAKEENALVGKSCTKPDNAAKSMPESCERNNEHNPEETNNIVNPPDHKQCDDFADTSFNLDDSLDAKMVTAFVKNAVASMPQSCLDGNTPSEFAAEPFPTPPHTEKESDTIPEDITSLLAQETTTGSPGEGMQATPEVANSVSPNTIPTAAVEVKSPKKQTGLSVMDTSTSDMPLDDSDLLLSDPHLEDLSLENCLLNCDDLDDVVTGGTATDLDRLLDNESGEEMAAKCNNSSDTASKHRPESCHGGSDPIVVQLPAEAGMEPLSLVIDNDDSDPFEDSDDDLDLQSSLSSAPLHPSLDAGAPSLPSFHSSMLPLATQVCGVTAGDDDSEFADLQAVDSPLAPAGKAQMKDSSEKQPMGFFNEFAKFVGLKQTPASSETMSPTKGYDSEFAKFLGQKERQRGRCSQKVSIKTACCLNRDNNNPTTSLACDICVNCVAASKVPELSKQELHSLANSHRKVSDLGHGVLKLLQGLFPHLDFPAHGSSSSNAEFLIEQVLAVLENRPPSPHHQYHCALPLPSPACSEPLVHVCSKPHHCLQQLRARVCTLLTALLPDLHLPAQFDRTGPDVEVLLHHVTQCSTVT